MDGYRLFEPTLTPRSVAPGAAGASQDALAGPLASTTFRKDVSPEWFYQPPSPLDQPVNPELEARSAQYQANGAENYLWNKKYLLDADGSILPFLRRAPQDEIFAFEPYDGTVFPHYRLFPAVNANVGMTNSYGWLASEIDFRKPANAVRIGLLGDSTSHNLYGRYLQSYLTSWAKAKNLAVKFEVLNAARQATDIDDMTNVLKYELGPVDLDYVFLYYGSRIPFYELVALPPGAQYGKPPPEGGLRRLARLAPPSLRERSALVRHAVAYLTDELPASILHEPAKPPVRVAFPIGVEFNPGVESAREIPYLHVRLAQLDRLKRAADDLGVPLITSTERFMAYDGMALNYRANHYLFDILNSEHWPLRYRDMQELAAFHNRVMQAWARERGVRIFDINALTPMIPTLHGDAVHEFEPGLRLRAWAIFQSLLPVLEKDLASGAIPTGSRTRLAAHPYLPGRMLRIPRTSLLPPGAGR